MTKLILIAGTTLALALPGTALATDEATPKENASKACKAERAAMGDATFKATYGTKSMKNAHGKCVSKATKAEKAAKENARTECAAERDADAATFTATYGTGKHGKNAFGKCVSSKNKAAREERTEARVNAAKACKAERTADAEAFATAYGSKKNAFGKCVSAKAKAQNDEEAAPTS